MRYYTVVQEREVKIVANSAIDAARIADAVFEQIDPPANVWGHASTPVRVRDLVTREDY